MRKKLSSLIKLLLGLSVLVWTSAAEEERTAYTCPLCENRFESWAPSKAGFETQFSGAKNMDSDFCYHSEGGSPLFRMVVTCPNCLYSAYAKEFSHSLRDSHKALLKSMLEKHPAPEGATETTGTPGGQAPATPAKASELPAWLRWQYAARCYRITRSDILFVGQTFHGAAYCARIEAAALATSKLSLENPESVLPQLEELEKKIPAENDKQKRLELMLMAAQAAQRGGFVLVRDKWTAQLSKEAGADKGVQEQLKTFRELVAAEVQCLREALECYQTAMNEELVPYRNRSLYNYLIGDILRRLGERRSSVVGYYAHVVEDDDARSDLRRLASYFIEYLNR